MKKIYSLFVFFLLLSGAAKAQYTTNADASAITPNVEYQLTPEATLKRGSVWKNAKVNLASNWSVNVEMYLGKVGGNNSGVCPNPDPSAICQSKTTGSDGIAFVIQNLSTGELGGLGQFMGYGGAWGNGLPIQPSVAVQFDTWRNIGADGPNDQDPVNDHMAILKNGSTAHGSADALTTPLEFITEIEDGMWHSATFSYVYTNPTTQTLTALITLGATTYTRTYTGNILSIIGASEAYIGFTASTGDAVNDHRVRFLADCSTYRVTATLPAIGCGNANTIYLGYRPQSITATASPASPASTYKWYRVASPADILVGSTATFTPTKEGVYYVVATNGTCSASLKSTTWQLKVIDVRCKDDKDDDKHSGDKKNGGHYGDGDDDDQDKDNGKKIYMCHKENGNQGNNKKNKVKTICVSVNAVAAHLAHGDCLGKCPNDKDKDDDRRRVAPGEATEEVPDNSNSFVYPNPSRGQVQVKAGTPNSVRSEILIMNSRGAVVERRIISGSAMPSFDLKKYGVGLYLIKIVTGTQVQTKKVLIQE